jgi:hypothetical protein
MKQIQFDIKRLAILHFSSVQLIHNTNEIIKRDRVLSWQRLQITQHQTEGHEFPHFIGNRVESIPTSSSNERSPNDASQTVAQTSMTNTFSEFRYTAWQHNVRRKQCSANSDDQSQPASVQTNYLLKAPFAAMSNVWNDSSIEHTLNLPL